jgi:hypothetical protein
VQVRHELPSPNIRWHAEVRPFRQDPEQELQAHDGPEHCSARLAVVLSPRNAVPKDDPVALQACI